MIGITGLTSQPSVETLVQRYLDMERQPINDLEKTKSDLQSKLKIFNDLRSKLDTLKDHVNSFINKNDSNVRNTKTAISSNTDVFKAEASSTAEVGVHSIFVSNLAKKDIALSKQFTNLSGTGLATKLDGTTQQFTIKVGENDPVTISIEFNDPTETNESVLKRIVTAIKESGAEVDANFFNDTPTSGRISLSSKDTGSVNKLELVEVSGSNILRKLDIIDKKNNRPQQSDSGGGFIYAESQELDARVNVNGIDIIKSSNIITDVLPNVTITLLSAQEEGEAPVSLTIERDKTEIKEEIDGFIKDYNALIEYLTEQTNVDAKTYTRGALAGNFAYMNLKLQMREIIASRNSSLSDPDYRSLADIGITSSRNGTIKIDDSDKLLDAIAENGDAVYAIFTEENGVASRLDELLSMYSKTGGKIDNNKNALDRQIDGIDNRISRYEERLRVRENVLRQEFTQLQRLLSSLNSQQAIIQNILSIGSGFYSTGTQWNTGSLF